MTTKTNEQKKQGDRPTHGLYAVTNQNGQEFKIRLMALWNNPEKGYMGVSHENLELRRNPNKEEGQPPFLLFAKTKVYGQDFPMQIASFNETDDKDRFKMNKIELVVFENKPREAGEQPKSKANGIPHP